MSVRFEEADLFNNEYESSLYKALINQLSDTVDNQAQAKQQIAEIVKLRHCGNNYWSWDGLLDDLTELVGYDRASEILNNC